MGVEASAPLPNQSSAAVSGVGSSGGAQHVPGSPNPTTTITTNNNISTPSKSGSSNIKSVIVPSTQPLRVLIRGVRGVGKTTLAKRLKGGSFISQYIPSPEINTFHINWQIGEEKAKIEVWDVVDEGFIKPSQDHPGKKSSLLISELVSDKAKADAILKGSSTGSHKIGTIFTTISA
jgi:hypothetical protein